MIRRSPSNVPVPPRRSALLLTIATLVAVAACSGDGASEGGASGTGDGGTGSNTAPPKFADDSFRIVHTADARWKGDVAQREMEAVLERFPQIDVIYAHNDAMARGAALACQQKGRTEMRILGVDGLPDEGRKWVEAGLLEATYTYPTCGDEAIKLALLACNGVDLPKRIQLGTRQWTKGSLASGGGPINSPGEFMFTNLCAQNGAALTTAPKEDVIFRIGMAQCTDDEPWRVQMGKDLKAAAAKFPQIEYVYRSANDDVETQRGIVRDFIAQNLNAILISPKESRALASACREAVDAGIKVIVIDRELGGDDGDFTTFIGGNNERIGAAAARQALAILGNGGGTIVELQGLMTSSPAQERHRGFRDELVREIEVIHRHKQRNK
ncbi:MAG: substrate-binding domain-containing protein [bacterium]|nr:substrate-binding domain-containing protein [bacterium]